jgi:hypothetical protein
VHQRSALDAGKIALIFFAIASSFMTMLLRAAQALCVVDVTTCACGSGFG